MQYYNQPNISLVVHQLHATYEDQDQAKIISIPPPHQTSHQKMSTTSSQSLSSALIVISANIEGLPAVKASMLSDLCKEQHCHCLCLQETQR